jgi:hypothetical protein
VVSLIGLSGYARSGKDTVANILVRDYDFVKVAFADPIRESLLALNPIVWSDDEGTWRVQDVIDEYGWDGYKDSLWGQEIRELLQKLGTEVGRKIILDEIWIEVAFRKIDDLISEGKKVVITDMRFENEADFFEGYGAEIWRVRRNGVGPANDHPSETELNDYPFDMVIDNNGSLDDLALVVREYLGSE